LAYLAEAEKGSLMLCENGSGYLAIKAAKGINKRLLGEIKVRAGDGIAGKVFEDGVPIMVSDIEQDDQLPLNRRPRYKTGSFISIPLVSTEKIIGVLNISDKISGDVFSEEDLVLLQPFAAYASIAIERTLYYNLVGFLKESSITDSLTGLFNRRYFEDRLFEELNRSERYGLPFSLALIDVDDFKLFNDTEGHLAGDDALKGISAIAKDSLRIIDVIARFGGEEFAVIMPQTEKEEAFAVVERIRKAVRERLPRTWETFPREHITICIGVSTFPDDGKNRSDLIRNADKALYSANMQGKDRTVICGQHGARISGNNVENRKP
jgi:diguanylate cyclase (GGDEF)-like protein